MPPLSIGSVGAAAAQQVTASGYLSETRGAQPTGASGFQVALGGAVDELQQLQATSNTLTVQAVTGNLNDIHAATLAATRAQVTLEVVAAVRNKGIDAFNEIMRMQA